MPFVRGAIDYLIETHDPETRGSVDRAELAAFSRDTLWLGLEIVATADDDIVEFIARGASNGRPFAQRERSRFRRVDGKWKYREAIRIAVR